MIREKAHEAQTPIPVDGVCTFMVEKAQAAKSLKDWVSSRWFAPGEFKKRGVEGKFDGVYMPYFTFDAMTYTRYTGERGDAYYVDVGSGENKKRERRVDWKENSLFAPPEWTFHQHFNTGPEPARYLALRRGGSPEHPLKIGMTGGKDAPDQIEYEEEPPWIYDMYEEELRKNGVTIGQPRPVYHNVRNTIVRPAAQKA